MNNRKIRIMKSIKNIFNYGFMFVMATLLFSACSNDDDYTPAEILKSNQVYFSNENIDTETNTQYTELSADASSFDVEISRVVADSALTVKLVCDSVPEGYTVPSSVTFAKGAKTAKITIGYDFNVIGYDNPSIITIKIADEKYTTPYGISQLSVEAVVPAPWTEWTSTKADWVKAGNKADEWPLSETESTCTYSYKNFWTGDDTELPIEYRQSTLDPTQGQFRITGCMYGIELVMNYNTRTHVITVVPQWTGYTHSTYGDVWITDAVNYWANIATNKADASASHTSTYNPETGLFSVCMAYYVPAGQFGYDAENIQVDGFYVPDYSVLPAFSGVLTTADGVANAQINVTLGVDAKNVQAIVVNSEDDAEAVADAILAGDVEGTKIEESGVVNVPIGEYTGELQVVCVSIADEAVQDIQTVGFEYYGGGKNPWVSLGKGIYTDDIVSSMFGNNWSLSDATYEVEIKQNTENGNYRIMNPYSNSVYPYADDDCAEEGRYIDVNAEDPEGVYVDFQDLGFDWGYGPMAMCTYGAYMLNQYDFAKIKAAGYFGKVVDNKILFPSFEYSGGKFQALLAMGEKMYYTATNEAFSITLPAGVTPSAKKYAEVSTAKAKAMKSLVKKFNGIKMPSGRILVNKNMIPTVKPSNKFK